MPRKQPPTGAFSVSDAGRYSWEHNDCAVRAMADATGKPYAECHALLKAAGRKDRSGTYEATVTKALGVPFTRTGRRAWGYRAKDTRPTAAKLMRELPKGNYIVFVTGHFFALVDGVHLDMADSLYRPRSRVHGYWEVKP